MPCDHPDVTTLLKPPFPSWLQLMTWAGSSVTVTFTGSSMVAVELDGHMTAVPAADRWINQTRNDLPSVVFQASACQGTNRVALQGHTCWPAWPQRVASWFAASCALGGRTAAVCKQPSPDGRQPL